MAKGIEHDERDIFEFFSVTQRSGYRMIEPGAPSRTYANSGALETRGRKRKVTSEQVQETDAILQDDALGLEEKALSWDQLALEVGAEVCGLTKHRIMSDALDYGKHLACMKGWLLDRAKAHRQEWATVMYRKYPKPEDWHRVRFSDEVHFGYGLEGQLRIIWRPGTRYRHDCIQHQPPPPSEEKDRKRKHCWAAVGYNFKSDIIFYDVPGNKNGKLTHQVYTDSILEPVVKPRITAGEEFCP